MQCTGCMLHTIWVDCIGSYGCTGHAHIIISYPIAKSQSSYNCKITVMLVDDFLFSNSSQEHKTLCKSQPAGAKLMTGQQSSF